MIVEEIFSVHRTGRPILVGTISIEKSEKLSNALRMRGVDHEVLNAKHHEREAQIITKAGQLGNVTIATNMAGRGTDIVLGKFELDDAMVGRRFACPTLRAVPLQQDLPCIDCPNMVHWA